MVCFVSFIFCSYYFNLYLLLRTFLAHAITRDTCHNKPILATVIGTPGSGISLIPVEWNQHHGKYTAIGYLSQNFLLFYVCAYTCTFIHTYIIHVCVCDPCGKIDVIYSCLYFTSEMNTWTVLPFCVTVLHSYFSLMGMFVLCFFFFLI